MSGAVMQLAIFAMASPVSQAASTRALLLWWIFGIISTATMGAPLSLIGVPILAQCILCALYFRWGVWLVRRHGCSYVHWSTVMARFLSTAQYDGGETPSWTRAVETDDEAHAYRTCVDLSGIWNDLLNAIRRHLAYHCGYRDV